jgi:hypothetical protein
MRRRFDVGTSTKGDPMSNQTNNLHEPERRILVIANETVEGPLLHQTIRFRTRAARRVEVLVIAPALNSRVRHWISDEDEARSAAEQRLTECLDMLARAGIEASGWVGDADPMQAMGDALYLFAADEIIVVAGAASRSYWLARRLTARARARRGPPIVDPRSEGYSSPIGEQFSAA